MVQQAEEAEAEDAPSLSRAGRIFTSLLGFGTECGRKAKDAKASHPLAPQEAKDAEDAEEVDAREVEAGAPVVRRLRGAELCCGSARLTKAAMRRGFEMIALDRNAEAVEYDDELLPRASDAVHGSSGAHSPQAVPPGTCHYSIALVCMLSAHCLPHAHCPPHASRRPIGMGQRVSGGRPGGDSHGRLPSLLAELHLHVHTRHESSPAHRGQRLRGHHGRVRAVELGWHALLPHRG